MKLGRIIAIVSVCFGLLLNGLSPSLAQQASATAGPIAITGDLFKIDEKARIATFSGNVIAKQTNFTLWAPTLIVSYGEGGTKDLREVRAEGGIRIDQPDQTATSDYGLYDPNTRILRMIGNVKTTSKSSGNVVESAEMIVDLKNDTTSFVGAPGDNGRVTAVFGQ